MHNICALSDLKIGQGGTVGKMETKGTMRRRLQDMGIIEGSDVECVLVSPGGDPSAYLVKGAVIAIRNEDCGDISVSVENKREGL